MITIAVITALATWWKKRGRRDERITLAEGRKRIRELRKKGYVIKKVARAPGVTVVERSRRPVKP